MFEPDDNHEDEDIDVYNVWVVHRHESMLEL